MYMNMPFSLGACTLWCDSQDLPPPRKTPTDRTQATTCPPGLHVWSLSVHTSPKWSHRDGPHCLGPSLFLSLSQCLSTFMTTYFFSFLPSFKPALPIRHRLVYLLFLPRNCAILTALSSPWKTPKFKNSKSMWYTVVTWISLDFFFFPLVPEFEPRPFLLFILLSH